MAAVQNTGLKWLIAVDGSRCSKIAVKFAYSHLIDNENDHVEVVHVTNPSKSDKLEQCHPNNVENMKKKYEEMITELRESGSIIEHRFVVMREYDHPRKVIVDKANQENFDVLVTGFHGDDQENVDICPPDMIAVDFHGVRGGKLGRVSDMSLRSAECSALICSPFSWIVNMASRVWVFALDGSKASELPFNMVHKQIRNDDQLHLVHVHNPSTDNSKIDSRFRPDSIKEKWTKIIDENDYPNATFHIIESAYISKSICELAEKVEATILILGADGMQKYYCNKDKSLIGSVTDLCVKNAACPVFVGQLMETQSLHD